MAPEGYKEPEDRLLSEDELKNLYDFYNKESFSDDEDYFLDF